ncbi:hypothetical protein DFA_01860 [Cavenderia fasciculata]|uniref:Transmembrane protein n=1 Tax=Cavenderia fasciculata TaxID=261658 RepID=F4PV66_CACFS|nr:uncharacterized protein DFA_01860 [Cavenderia fasciculata]EGG21974.1 hypothetical protein DFA_01860 [Cavenderia fasciculata]|eukprot:XP_004359825.1 hypothetical protein DFA_01860 [Cavenderia fasciculata]
MELQTLAFFGCYAFVINVCTYFHLGKNNNNNNDNKNQQFIQDAWFCSLVIIVCAVATYLRIISFPLPRTPLQQMANTTIRFVIEMFQLYSNHIFSWLRRRKFFDHQSLATLKSKST